MERTPELFEKIELYLTNALSSDEVTAFEKEIEEDQSLKLEVEKHRSLHQTLSDQDALDFKEKLKEISAKVKKEEASSTFFSSFWKIAASIVVLLGLTTLFWYTGNDHEYTKDLYAQYYQPFPIEDVSRGEQPVELQTIMKSYAKADYTTVISALEKKQIIFKNEELRLYLGNSYLNTNQEEKAIVQFESIQKSSQYFENGKWYLMLTYLKLGNIKKSKAILKEIIQYNGIYKANAIKLLAALSK